VAGFKSSHQTDPDATCEILFEAVRACSRNKASAAPARGDCGGRRLHARSVLFEFRQQDELIIGMLEDHVEQSIPAQPRSSHPGTRTSRLLEALQEHGPRRPGSARALGTCCNMEMILFVAGAEKRRPKLANRCGAGEAGRPTSSRPRCKQAARTDSVNRDMDRRDRGWRWRRLPPAPPDHPGHAVRQFLRAITDLQRAIGIT